MTTQIDEIVELDNRLQRWMRTGWPESWLQINVPLGSVRALLVLDGGYANTPSSIAEVLRVSRASVTGMLDRLEAEKFITRAIDPSDRRCFVLELTDRGRELVRQIDDVRRGQIKQALLRMEPAALMALQTGLEALNKAVRESKTEIVELLATKKEVLTDVK